MKQQNLLTKMLLLFALVVGSVTSMWAKDVLVYTLDTSKQKGSANSYASENTATVDNIGWAVYGNLTELPWRIGGKSITNVDRTARTTTKMGEAISKVALTIGNNSGITVNSLKLVVANDVDFQSQIDEVSATFAPNSTINFTPSASVGTEWPKDAFYKFVFNVTVSGSSNKYFQFSKVEFYKTVSGPLDPTVTISSNIVAVGGTAEISGPDGLTMTFNSSNTNIATINNNGIVTGVAEGETTITATWDAVADTYNAGSQEFTVTVKEATVYEKVTSTNQLVAGYEYILVATESNMAMGADNDKKRTNVAVTISSDNKVTIIDEAVAVLTLGGSTDAWTFLASDNDLYLALTANSNEIHTSNDPTANTSKWKITSDFQIQSVAQSDTRYIRYNSGSPRFCCYKSGQVEAYLFVKAGSPQNVTITPASGLNYISYSNTLPLDFTEVEGLTAFIVSTDNGTSVKLTEVKKVPANTGLVLKKTGTDADYSVPVLNGEADSFTNLLIGTADGPKEVEARTVYVLNSGQFKLFTGTTIPQGKAYLPSSNDDAPALDLDFGEGTTEIQNIERTISDDQYYTLDGRRVAQPTKGLYILNGKKVILK